MSAPAAGSSTAHAPVAVVWCRQVDNEAESPGYTTIPDDFPGRRETLETIRIVGNLTVNVADTHDYWDPDPSQPLSYYPNLFLYPSAGGRYTCVGRMFLSTEDRPRIGMKTLVFDTAALVASGEFSAAVLRAHATMGGRSSDDRPAAEPDQSVYQGVGEGFLFHRGSTEPVVLVSSEQWEAANQVVLDLVAQLPTALVALGAFLVFPYFLPVAKVDMHQFTEQLPLALAVMRVPRGEAQGERHLKRVAGWDGAPVTLRDLTRAATGRAAKDALPLVLQYARDHAEDKLGEVSRRVDLVEGPRLPGLLADRERQAGRDRRKEMWRIGTAMETAALLLSRPRGRTVTGSGEAAKRANEYVKARPAEPDGGRSPSPGSLAAPLPELAGNSSSTLPPWLMRPVEVNLPPSEPGAVPVSIQTDPSLFKPSTPAPAAVAPMPAGTAVPPSAATSAPPPPPPPPPTPREVSAPGVSSAEVDAKIRSTLDTRLQEASESAARALALNRAEVTARLTALESRPTPSAEDLSGEVERRVRQSYDPRLAEIPDQIQRSLKAAGDAWATSFKTDLDRISAEMSARSVRSEEELRAALVAQLDLELAEAKEQGSALREQIEGRVRTLIETRMAELETKRAKDTRDLEQRLGLLLDGRSKDLETRMMGQLDERVADLDQKRTREGREADARAAGSLDARSKEMEGRISALLDARAKELEARVSNQLAIGRSAAEERLSQLTKRLEVDREARFAEISETHAKSLAGLQVRMQSYLDQKMREDSDRERSKYVELLARLKGEVDEALARTIDSTRFDAAVRERVQRATDESRREFSKGLADLETRLAAHRSVGTDRLDAIESKLQERADAIAAVEAKVQKDVEDLDRRAQVVNDKMLPLVRKTWVRIEEIEKLLGGADETEARFGQLRRDLGRELRRVEGELREEQAHLRRRLENSMTSQSKIWLNLVRQLSESGAGYVPTEEDLRMERSRRSEGRPIDPDDADLLGRPRSRESPYVDYAEEPANPLDPEPPAEPSGPPRRPSARPARGGAQR